MDIVTKGQVLYQGWVNGLSASDNVTLLATGFCLMIFAVAAVLWKRRKLSDTARPHYSVAATVVPGERHVAVRQKGDAFMRRLERMA